MKFDKLLFAGLMTISLMAGLSNFMNPANVFVLLAVLLSLLLILQGRDVTAVYVMIALIPYFSSLRLSGFAFGFIIPVVAFIKLWIRHFSGALPKLLIAAFLFLFIGFFHDIQYSTFMESILRSFMPLYVFAALSWVRFEKYNRFFAAWVVIGSSLIAMYCVFMVQGANLDSFIYSSYAGEMRLGEADVDSGQKNQLGGAMGFPIYTITILSLIVQMFLMHSLRFWQKILMLSISVVVFFLTFLTVSRVYLLGLGVLIILLLYYIARHVSIKVFVGFLCVFLFLGVMAAMLNPDFITSVFSQYEGRITNSDNHHIGSRGYIYRDCIDYLSSNLECILIGKGTLGYVAIGKQMNTWMSMSAHNFLLDGLLSFGIIGFFFVFYAFYKLYKKERFRTRCRVTALHCMPLFCILAMYITSTPFMLEKVWPFFLFLVLNITPNEEEFIRH